MPLHRVCPPSCQDRARALKACCPRSFPHTKPAQLGIPGKYHETITWFFMFLIDERRRNSTSNDWYQFRRCNSDLFARGEQSILNRYYQRETLDLESARRSFVLPDRLAV